MDFSRSKFRGYPQAQCPEPIFRLADSGSTSSARWKVQGPVPSPRSDLRDQVDPVIGTCGIDWPTDPFNLGGDIGELSTSSNFSWRGIRNLRLQHDYLQRSTMAQHHRYSALFGGLWPSWCGASRRQLSWFQARPGFRRLIPLVALHNLQPVHGSGRCQTRRGQKTGLSHGRALARDSAAPGAPVG